MNVEITGKLVIDNQSFNRIHILYLDEEGNPDPSPMDGHVIMGSLRFGEDMADAKKIKEAFEGKAVKVKVEIQAL